MVFNSTEDNERKSSNVAVRTHRLWEALAIPGGITLVLHAVLSFILLPLSPLFLFLCFVELIIGLITIIVDAWFLLHV